MDVLLYVWLMWVLLCTFLVLFGVATPLLKTYDLWVGFFWDGDRKLLYVFPIPMIGCVIYLGRKVSPSKEMEVVNHYLMEIPEDVYRELEALADSSGVPMPYLVKKFIEIGIEVQKELDAEETEVTLDD